MFSREDIANIVAGKTKIAIGVDGYFYDPEIVTEIVLSGETEDGRLYVAGYTLFKNARWYFNVQENHSPSARHYHIFNE